MDSADGMTAAASSDVHGGSPARGGFAPDNFARWNLRADAVRAPLASSSRTLEPDQWKQPCYRQGRRYRQFTRSFGLPVEIDEDEVYEDEVYAEFDEGVLTLTANKGP